jgi:S1-C subfamily serine protease
VPNELNLVGNGVSQIADRELRVCTVRIDIDGSPKGTGFFVVPGHVLTCAHVLESLGGPSVLGTARRIAVRGVDDAEYTVAKVAEKWEDDDLAVLRVTPADQHPCVLLVGGQNFDDRFTFGYTEPHPEGVASRLVGEGNTGDERLLRLGEGQVQPGMSGGPLLNQRTGGVCGVLKLTRNEQMALGGYAIPIERFWLLSPTLKRQNEGYHYARRHEWLDLLPLVQRRVLLAARPGTSTAKTRTTLFVVSVGGDRSNWRVSARALSER